VIVGDGGQARRRIGGRIGAEQRRLLDVRIGGDESSGGMQLLGPPPFARP
jgi:hypothetical protein